MSNNKVDIIQYDDKAQEVKVKYLGPIPYRKIKDIDTTEGHAKSNDKKD